MQEWTLYRFPARWEGSEQVNPPGPWSVWPEKVSTAPFPHLEFITVVEKEHESFGVPPEAISPTARKPKKEDNAR